MANNDVEIASLRVQVEEALCACAQVPRVLISVKAVLCMSGLSKL